MSRWNNPLILHHQNLRWIFQRITFFELREIIWFPNLLEFLGSNQLIRLTHGMIPATGFPSGNRDHPFATRRDLVVGNALMFISSLWVGVGLTPKARWKGVFQRGIDEIDVQTTEHSKNKGWRWLVWVVFAGILGYNISDAVECQVTKWSIPFLLKHPFLPNFHGWGYPFVMF